VEDRLAEAEAEAEALRMHRRRAAVEVVVEGIRAAGIPAAADSSA
jgi:hypothetical protein